MPKLSVFGPNNPIHPKIIEIVIYYVEFILCTFFTYSLQI